MQRIISQIHQWLARLLLLGFVLQVYLATAPLFGVGVTFRPHRVLGSVLAILIILLLVLAVAGRLGRQWIRLSILLVFDHRPGDTSFAPGQDLVDRRTSCG